MTEQIKPKSPLSIFFSLGDKVTKGDPLRKSSFDYYMLWIIFLAFFGVCIGNFRKFFFSGYELQYLGWALFGLAVIWFQYFSLRSAYEMREVQKEFQQKKEEHSNNELNKIESINEMIEGFEDKKNLKDYEMKVGEACKK